MPSARGEKSWQVAEAINKGRLERALTQKQLADAYGLSLRVIRDLEQGKRTASLQSVIEVLGALDRKLSVT